VCLVTYGSSTETSRPHQPRQAGHTNCWQLCHPLGSDLLGQAQAERAVRVGINTSLRTIRTGVCVRGCDLCLLCDRSVDIYYPKMVLKADSSQPRTHDEPPCHSLPSQRAPACPAAPDTGHPSKATPEDLFYLLSCRVVHNNQPDVVLECLGSQWELHCPHLTKSGTLSDLYMSARQKRARSLQDSAESRKSGRDKSHSRPGSSNSSRDKQNGKKPTGPLVLHLSVKDAAITKEDNTFVIDRCLTEMINKISSSTVCDFRRVSCKYKETSLQRACERWMELYLVTELRCFIYLRDLQLRSFPTIGTDHIGLKVGVFRRAHLEEMQQIHVFPQSWLLLIFSNHYYTLHSGGDMQVTDFSRQTLRFGIVIKREPRYCTQTIELYGFYFLLKAANMREPDSHGFLLQRLRHWDHAMSVLECERHPFSMITERAVSYQINVQARVHSQRQDFNSSPINQEIGLSKRTCKNQVFKVKGLSLPIFVTFALTFPAV
ncbi:unnamed protein product, partial [Coregonus sp. 'balchen']